MFIFHPRISATYIKDEKKNSPKGVKSGVPINIKHTGIYIIIFGCASTCSNLVLIDKMQTYEIRWFYV